MVDARHIALFDVRMQPLCLLRLILINVIFGPFLGHFWAMRRVSQFQYNTCVCVGHGWVATNRILIQYFDPPNDKIILAAAATAKPMTGGMYEYDERLWRWHR